MIRLSKLADYAFVILTQMVSRHDAPWAAGELATRTALPGPTVAKILKMLARGNVVVATRGATGGYRLKLAAEDISVIAIVEAVDGPVALTACVVSDDPDCAARNFCPMHQGWDKINRAMRGALTDVTLADLVADVAAPLPRKAAP